MRGTRTCTGTHGVFSEENWWVDLPYEYATCIRARNTYVIDANATPSLRCHAAIANIAMQQSSNTFHPRTMRLLSGAALLATVASSVAAANVLSLTDNNYEQLTAGKPVFIKFFAPCKSDRKRNISRRARLHVVCAEFSIGKKQDIRWRRYRLNKHNS